MVIDFILQKKILVEFCDSVLWTKSRACIIWGNQTKTPPYLYRPKTRYNVNMHRIQEP